MTEGNSRKLYQTYQCPSLVLSFSISVEIKKKKNSFIISNLFFVVLGGFVCLFLRNHMLIFLLFSMLYCPLPFLQEDASQSCYFT